jgi:hypothetical protein
MDGITKTLNKSTFKNNDAQDNRFSKGIIAASEIVLRAIVGYFLAFAEDLTVLAGDVGGVPKSFNKVKENTAAITKLLNQLLRKDVIKKS